MSHTSNAAAVTPSALQQPLGMWVIYDRPKDYPDKFVARQFYVGPNVILASDNTHEADTLSELRAKLPKGLVRFDREPTDEPQIVESWA